MPDSKLLTGYPSIDKPWLKYYSEEAINAPLPECTMYEYIWENNKGYLTDVALRYYGTKITYGKLFDNIKKAASSFYTLGIRAGDIVTIMSMHTPETIYAIYALNYIGAVANMVYMTLAEKEILETLANTESKLLLVLDAVLEKVEAVKDKIGLPIVVMSVSDSMPPHIKLGYRLKVKPKTHGYMTWKDFLAYSTAEPPVSHNHAAPAVIIYTSGTTGEPKGVELTSDNINAVSHQYKYVDASICRGDTILVFMPPFLAIGLCYLHMPICLGVELIICANPEPNNVVNEFIRQRPNHFVTAPSNALMVIERNIQDYSFLKSFGAGGESISIQDECRVNNHLQENGAVIKYSAGYGMTEFSAIVTVNSNSAHKIGTIGIPLVKTCVRVTDQESRQELPYNLIGELLFCTPSQMKGYVYNKSDDTSIIEEFGDGVKWIRTGDLGYVDDDGFVHYVGRMKRICMTRVRHGNSGQLIKIFPQRIEECIEQIDEVLICGVVVREDEDRLNVPIAFVSLTSQDIDPQNAESTIKQFVDKQLPEHDRPEDIHILNAMPMTASGKVDYCALEEMVKESIDHA